jgi:protein phosphatase methylesterase 1
VLVLCIECRLDKSLTIGQMQGKFQLVLMPTAGHAIQVGCEAFDFAVGTKA